MKFLVVSIQIILFALILGCNNKSAYEAWQHSDQWACQRNPTANCEDRMNYEEYETERDKFLKKKQLPERSLKETKNSIDASTLQNLSTGYFVIAHWKIRQMTRSPFNKANASKNPKLI